MLGEPPLPSSSARFGVSIELVTKVKRFDQATDRVDVRLHICLDGEGREEIVRPQYVLGSEGGSSTARRLLDLDFMPDAHSGRKSFVYGNATSRCLQYQVGFFSLS
jgi:2-polyprenyl-6-methoxyphenol hydroxylase-like FAD-dependent oxidoreductase